MQLVTVQTTAVLMKIISKVPGIGTGLSAVTYESIFCLRRKILKNKKLANYVVLKMLVFGTIRARNIGITVQ
jgi:hypothetical protein